MIVVGLWMGLTTIDRIHVWGGGDRALWREAVAHSPEKPRPWINLGTQYARDEADAMAFHAYIQAVRLSLDPRRQRVNGSMRGGDVARLNIAILHARHGRYDEALAWTAQIHSRATEYRGHRSLVTLLEGQWRNEQAHGGPPSAF